MKPPVLSVVVVDDHDLLREGVTASLAAFSDIKVVGEASSGAAALRVVADTEPDVVIMDLVMPGLSGVDTIRRLRDTDKQIGIIALSSFTESNRVREVLEAGANGYLAKSVDADSLARAVRSAAAGQGAFSPEVTRALTSPKPVGAKALESLTTREADAARLMAEGRTNAEIAQEMGVSVFTVKSHVSSVLFKLSVQSRTEATAVILKSSQNRGY